jgi:myo-inositol-1(or 4)-monophosphatase
VTVIDFAAFIDNLATVSGDTILPFFRTSIGVDNKLSLGFDPVTEADRAAEVAMRRLINTTFPQHGIVGEEFGNERPDAEYVWVLDPIDGTKSFISGLPLWGTLIALLHNGVPAFGMMHQPYMHERFFGDGGGASFRGSNGSRQLSVRHCASLADATLFATTPQMFQGADRAAFDRVDKQVRLTRYGGDCYAYCMLAAGHVDLVIEAGLNSYDIAALVPIITGAGGVVTTWDGGPAHNGGRVIAAGDRRVHEAALKLLHG